MTTKFLRTDDTTKRIVGVKFVRALDDCPDLSFIGEYTDASSDWAIVRDTGEYLCRMGDNYDPMPRGREYRFFVPYAGGEEQGTFDYIAQGLQDFARMEGYNRGDWHMTFCQAIAQVSINGVMQKVTSGGIGGVESDSDESYFAELRTEEFDALRSILKSLGFTSKQITAAIKKSTDED